MADKIVGVERRRRDVKVKTRYEFPPIPVRDFDWVAIDDDTYEPGCPVGYGRTEREAVSDLLDQLELTT